MSEHDKVPEIDLSDPAMLEAFYAGNSSSFKEHYRKVVQAQCEEMIRAEYALKGEKITEGRIETLARLHPNYLDFLRIHLAGQGMREKAVFQRIGL